MCTAKGRRRVECGLYLFVLSLSQEFCVTNIANAVYKAHDKLGYDHVVSIFSFLAVARRGSGRIQMYVWPFPDGMPFLHISSFAKAKAKRRMLFCQ